MLSLNTTLSEAAVTDRPLRGGRSHVLLAAAIITGFLGCITSWSVISGALIETYGWAPQALSLTYSIFTLGSLTAQNLAGQLQRRFPPRTITLVASLMIATGWILPGFVTSIPTLCLGVSVLGGIGHGMCYNTALATSAKWYPDRKGLASGVCIGCMGLSPLLFGPAIGACSASFGITDTLKMLGLAMGTAVFASSWLMKIPQGQVPKPTSSRPEKTLNALRKPAFWAIWLIFLTAAIPGTILIGHVSEIARQFAGMPVELSALMVSIMALANFIARLGFGALSDRIGRFPALSIEFLLILAGSVTLPFGSENLLAFVAGLCMVSLGYGGMMSVVPALCSDALGEADFSRNYALLFSAFTSAAFIGPNVASVILVNTGSYAGVFPLVSVCAIAGLAAIFVTLKTLAGSSTRSSQNRDKGDDS